MSNESDTLPFTNQFNYSVKEISIEEYLTVLTELKEAEDELNRHEAIKANAAC